MLNARRLFPFFLLVLTLAALGWSLSFRSPPPADFRFVNGDEIKTIDPANVTGAPEGRIIRALFEGLLDWHPKTLEPVPGVAFLPDISPDETVYTFRLRDDAVWTDARLNTRPVVADDFVYSWRRFLDPITASQYASLLFDVAGAEKYNRLKIEPGDPVEIELPRPPPLGGPRGELLWGELVSVEEAVIGQDAEGNDETTSIFTVITGGDTRRYCPQAQKLNRDDVRPCAQVLYDFREVGIKALDERTLQVTLNEPVAYFEKLLGFYPLFPVNRQCIESHGYPEWTKAENLVNNGAFLLDERRFRDRIRFRKNPTYWDRENIHLESMEALAIASDTTGLNLYETGKVDWIITVPSTTIPALLAADRPDFQPPTQLAIYYYNVNATKPPLGVPRDIAQKMIAEGREDELEALREKARKVRRALFLALDNREIVERLAKAGEKEATGFVPPGIEPYDRVKQRWRQSHGKRKIDPQRQREEDIAQARRLLADAGYPQGQGFPKIELLYNDSESHERIAELVQSQWQDVLRIDTELIKKDWASYLADQRQKNYFVARAGWIGDYMDPYTFLELLTTDHAQNNSGWSDPLYHYLTTQTISDRFASGLLADRKAEVTSDDKQALLAYVEGRAELDAAVLKKLSEAGIEKLNRLRGRVEQVASEFALTEEEIAEIEEQVRARDNWQEQYHDSWVKLERRRLVRLKKFLVAERFMLEHAPVIPIYFYVSKAMCRPYVKGWYQNLQDVHPYRGVRIDWEEKRELFKELGIE